MRSLIKKRATQCFCLNQTKVWSGRKKSSFYLGMQMHCDSCHVRTNLIALKSYRNAATFAVACEREMSFSIVRTNYGWLRQSAATPMRLAIASMSRHLWTWS